MTTGEQLDLISTVTNVSALTHLLNPSGEGGGGDCFILNTEETILYDEKEDILMADAEDVLIDEPEEVLVEVDEELLAEELSDEINECKD